jgi:hypothetical protein
LEGLQSTTKRCRRHYGFSWGNLFRAGIDSELNAYYDFYSGKKMVSGIMKWMIAKVGALESALLDLSLWNVLI